MKANNKKIYIIGLLLVTLILSAGIASAATRINTATSTNTTGTGTSSYSGATNLVVDYDNTALDSDLKKGESGVLTLVITNVGGHTANNVDVWLPSLGDVNIDKRFTVGSIDSGESKSLQTTVRVSNNASLGLHIIQARVSYNGYTSNGASDDNKGVTLEIPLRVYGNPAFQVAPEKTTYYKDSIDELTIDVSVKDAVKNLKSTLSSDGFTVIGSSQKQIGDIGSNQKFTLIYEIKPISSGSSQSSLTLEYDDAAGQSQEENISFGLNIQDAGVDFKITNISYKPNPTGPGDNVDVTISLKNTGGADAQDTSLTLSLDDPFAPIDSPEKYVGEVKAGKEASATFKISVGFDASTMTYTIPLNISYKVGGSSYSVAKDIGINAGGSVILKIISVDTSSGSVKIDIANIGTRTATSVLATLITGSPDNTPTGFQGGRIGDNSMGNQSQGRMNRTGGGNFTGGFPAGNSNSTQTYVQYKASIKTGADTIFTFSNVAGTGQGTLLIEYSGEDNKRITQREQITLGSRSTALSTARTGTRSNGLDLMQIGGYAAIVLVIAAAIFYLYKRRKKKK